MYYVNIKIKTKNTVGIAKRIVIFLHCSFPVKCLGGRYMGVALCNGWAAILIPPSAVIARVLNKNAV